MERSLSYEYFIDKKETQTMSLSVRARKAKGRKLQKWACSKIGALLNIPWGYEDNKLIQPRLMGQKGVDVILRGDALRRFPFSVECKATENWVLPKAIKQARKNKLKGTNWLLIMKRKEFQNPIVVLDANTFFKLLEKEE